MLRVAPIVGGRIRSHGSPSLRSFVSSLSNSSYSIVRHVPTTSATVTEPVPQAYQQRNYHTNRTTQQQNIPGVTSNKTIQIPQLGKIKRNEIKSNIVLMGPPGSGKTTIGRALSRSLGMAFLDVDDDWLEPQWSMSVGEKLKQVGDDAFIQLEGETLQKLQVSNTIISLSGSNPLHPKSIEHIAKDSTIYYLDILPSEILSRCDRMKVDRIVGQSSQTLASILSYRQRIYESSYDKRIIIGLGETPESIAGRMETIVRERREIPSKYVSTRGFTGARTRLDFLDVVSLGLSPDRGLFVPEGLVGEGKSSSLKFTSSEWKRLYHDNLSYPELALRILERFPLGNRLVTNDLRRILQEGYSTFEDPKIVLPLVHLEIRSNNKNTNTSTTNTSSTVPPASSSSSSLPPFHPSLYLMETFHGPTASFKDLSLQILPKLLQHSIEQRRRSEVGGDGGGDRETTGLLVATSGDTGTAALDGFSRSPGVPVIVFYPSNGVSIVQKAQMQTTDGDVLILGIESDFDYCQTLVKDIFNDIELKKDLQKIVPNLNLSSANSMNWGRFLPQIVFTVASYLNLIRQSASSSKKLSLGDSVNLVIPTGNFGNILGAVYAKLILGLPLGRIVCASNSNNVLYEFLKTGTYDLRKRTFQQTLSPSIDILVSSNLERFLYLLNDGDTQEIRMLFEQLSKEGYFTISSKLLSKVHDILEAGWTNEQECLETIRETHQKTGHLIDPHTAVAVHVANSVFASDPSKTPILISSTAHYGKFPHAMCHAFGIDVPQEDTTRLDAMFRHLSQIDPVEYQRTMHPELLKLIERPILHTTTCQPDRKIIVEEIKQFLKQFADKYNKRG